MSHRNVVPGPLGEEVRPDLGSLRGMEPPIVVRARDAVLGVLEGLAARHRRRRGRVLVGGHVGQRSARLVAVAAVVVASLAPGLSLAPAQASEDEPVTFTVAYLNEVDSFNPFLGIEASSFEMWSLMYDSLTGYAMEDMQPTPALATEWDTSDDGLTWTYTLRDDATWSDGEPLTAQDVLYTYERIRDGGPERATWGVYLKGVESVSAPDDTTVVLELEEPSALLPLLPIPIVPEHVWKDVSDDEMRELRQRALRRRAGRGVRAVPAGRGYGGRLDVPLRGESRLLGRRTPPRRAGLPRLQVRGPGDPGARSPARSTSSRASTPSRCRRSRAETGSAPRWATRRASTRSRSTPGRST